MSPVKKKKLKENYIRIKVKIYIFKTQVKNIDQYVQKVKSNM